MQARLADILAIQLDATNDGDPYHHGLYNGMLYACVANDGGEYLPIGRGGAAELAALREQVAVFTAPKEDFKDWPEDRGEHPQRGVAK